MCTSRHKNILRNEKSNFGHTDFGDYFWGVFSKAIFRTEGNGRKGFI
jgi:hypothetical protein